MSVALELLEWPQIIAHLDQRCLTDLGRKRLKNTDIFFPSPDLASAESQRVEDVKRLLQRYGEPSLSNPPDITPTLLRLAKEGMLNSPEEAHELLTALAAFRQLMRHLIQHRDRESMPLASVELESITLPNPAIERLEALIDSRGLIRESASPTFAALSQQVIELKATIKQTLNHLMFKSGIARYLQETIVTERDGRSVLPVRAEHKVDVPGMVHGSSASGSTLYIEPKQVVDLNNKRAVVQGQLEQEIQRLLVACSVDLHPMVPELQSFMDEAARWDTVMAKARQSITWDAYPIGFARESGVIDLKTARHPVLLIQGEPVVPNDVRMHPPHRVMLITGPNTGGKTVVLKLVGLFALMARAGLHLPCKPGGLLSWFDPVMVDIGDAQNLSQSLSTFSGHMARLKEFLAEPQLHQGLVLIDEICAGTDPEEGAALAEALLSAFYKAGATALVTTHIGELKVMAHTHAGFLNASVEFDPQSLSPTYRLLIGVPGSSHALSIAERLGIPAHVIAMARQKGAAKTDDSASLLIESLGTQQRQAAEDADRIAKLREEIAWEEAQLRETLNRIEGEKKRTLQMFRDSIKHKLRHVEGQVDDLKKQMQRVENPTEQQVSRFNRRFSRIQDRTGELFREEQDQLFTHLSVDWSKLSVGDEVESRSLQMRGVIVQKNDAKQEVVMQSGMLTSTVKANDIILPSSGKVTAKSKGKHKASDRSESRSQSGHVPQAKGSSWMSQCDVRGLNSEEAIGLLEKALDDAMLAGSHELHVVHGLGTGALKKAIRSYLKGLPFIKGFAPAEASQGGDGKTIILL